MPSKGISVRDTHLMISCGDIKYYQVEMQTFLRRVHAALIGYPFMLRAYASAGQTAVPATRHAVV